MSKYNKAELYTTYINMGGPKDDLKEFNDFCNWAIMNNLYEECE